MDVVATLPARHRLSVDDYHRMGEAGILDASERTELIDGGLIDMAPIGTEHSAAVGGLAEALFLACVGRAIVWPQNPVILDGSSEPQPDLAVLRRRADFYRTAHPGPADILLLVEVADSSLHYDQTVKLPLYARAGIPEVWIVDLRQNVLRAYRSPCDGQYPQPRVHASGDVLTLAAAPEIVVRLGAVLG